jgi:hypothetical protein
VWNGELLFKDDEYYKKSSKYYVDLRSWIGRAVGGREIIMHNWELGWDFG